MSDIFDKITKDFLRSKRANFAQPLRLQPDYGERQAELDIQARFHEGPQGRKEFKEWMGDQPKDFQEEWEANTEEYGDKFKKARFHEGPQGRKEFKEWMGDQPEDFQEEWEANTEEYGDKFKNASDFFAEDHLPGSYMSRQNLRDINDMSEFIEEDIGEEELEDWVEDKISHAHADLNDVARYRGYRDRHTEETFKQAATFLGGGIESDLYDEYDFDEFEDMPMSRTAAASGLYGYTKRVQGDVESAIRKLQKKVDSLARFVESKHPEAGSYFSARAENATCPASKALSRACLINKAPSRVLNGPYGFKSSVAKASQKAISDLILYSGEVAHGLYLKDRAHVPFLKEHLRRKRCPLTRLIIEALPSDAI
jgi:hypothetical protein